jgi:hypothetical protein
MAPKIAVSHSSAEPARWSVTLDDAEIVSFAGPRAEQLAEQSRRDLVDFLDVASKTDEPGDGRRDTHEG